MAPSDLAEVAALHAEAFPGFFLSRLGVRALIELYAGMLGDSRAIALVAEADRRVVGFAAGTIDARGYYRRLLVRRWWRFAWAISSQLLRHPMLLFRLAWRIRSATISTAHEGEAVLLSLAVLPRDQGRGVGRSLVTEFLRVASAKGARRVSLTTDAAENERVERFYESLKFRRRQTYTTPEQRLMHEYVVDL